MLSCRRWKFLLPAAVALTTASAGAQCVVWKVEDESALHPGHSLVISRVQPPPAVPAFGSRYRAEPIESLTIALASGWERELGNSGFFPSVAVSKDTTDDADLLLKARLQSVSPYELIPRAPQFIPIPLLVPAKAASLRIEGEFTGSHGTPVYLRWACAAESYGTWLHSERQLMHRTVDKVARGLRHALLDASQKAGSGTPGSPLLAASGPVEDAWMLVAPDYWRTIRPAVHSVPPCSAYSRVDTDGTLLATAYFAGGHRGEIAVYLVYYKNGPVFWNPSQILNSARLQAHGFASPLAAGVSHGVGARLPNTFLSEHSDSIWGKIRKVIWGVHSADMVFVLDGKDQNRELLLPFQVTLNLDRRNVTIRFDPAHCALRN